MLYKALQECISIFLKDEIITSLILEMYGYDGFGPMIHTTITNCKLFVEMWRPTDTQMLHFIGIGENHFYKKASTHSVNMSPRQYIESISLNAMGTSGNTLVGLESAQKPVTTYRISAMTDFIQHLLSNPIVPRCLILHCDIRISYLSDLGSFMRHAVHEVFNGSDLDAIPTKANFSQADLYLEYPRNNSYGKHHFNTDVYEITMTSLLYQYGIETLLWKLESYTSKMLRRVVSQCWEECVNNLEFAKLVSLPTEAALMSVDDWKCLHYHSIVFTVMDAVFMDVYFIANWLQPTTAPTKSILYAGAAHIERVSQILIRLGFEMVQKIGACDTTTPLGTLEIPFREISVY